jgi:pyruvate dehydrogenase E1 component
MYAQDQNIFYYLTVYNETYPMPAMPQGAEEGIIRGMYCFESDDSTGPKIHLLGSGSIMQEVIKATAWLRERGFSVDIWSVTSYTELLRDTQACEREKLLDPSSQRRCYAAELMLEETGIIIAASDFMKVLPASIARSFELPFLALGTDGFGLSEARDDLRDHFEVSAKYIAWGALTKLAAEGVIDRPRSDELALELGIEKSKLNPISL